VGSIFLDFPAHGQSTQGVGELPVMQGRDEEPHLPGKQPVPTPMTLCYDWENYREDRVPKTVLVDHQKCTGCGICVKSCPVGILETLPEGIEIYLGCSSKDKGPAVKKYCKVGCIACRLCVKATESGEITMDGNLPTLQYGGQEDFDAALDKCPMNCFVRIQDRDAIGAPADVTEETPAT
jgi:NAD-dependent dihydropyrimidine dehydrogenase PreA subunit